MRVIERVAEFSDALDAERAAGRTVGLVATMGALHDGHLSLVERAAEECDVVAVTIFVNTLQFGPGENLATYPRGLDGDLALAEKAGATHVLAPSEGEMLPPGRRSTVHVEGLSEVLEGASRPGHFDGVATMVTKLLALTGRCRTYFGEKDFQQLVIVRRLVADLSFPVQVVACPTVRARAGVALSSRNALLDTAQRDAAAVLLRALRAGAAAVIAGEDDPGAVRALVADIVDAEPGVELDYAEVVEADSLAVPPTLAGDLRLLVAARVGPVRLIDNLGVHA